MLLPSEKKPIKNNRNDEQKINKEKNIININKKENQKYNKQKVMIPDISNFQQNIPIFNYEQNNILQNNFQPNMPIPYISPQNNPYLNFNPYQNNYEINENKSNIKDNEEEVEEEEEEEDEEKDEEINIGINKDIALKKENNDNKEKIKNKKCSLTEHAEHDAVSFCQRCQIYMCDKCQKVHAGLLKNHLVYNLYQNNNDIFTGICKEKNHINKLEYFCRNHNQLCCAACITKIKCKGNGKHKNCTIYYINKIKNNKKDKLNSNIKYLEDLSSKLEQSIKELKELFDNISENKENLKMKIQKIFTKIRKEIL